MTARLALVGGRGYTGSAFLELLASHPEIELAAAVSRSAAGLPLSQEVPSWSGEGVFEGIEAENVGRLQADAWVLALPNGHAAHWTERIAAAHPHALVIDLSADHRFDSQWAYGLPELGRDAIADARRVANPGCYATAALLGLAPIAGDLSATPAIFGVSGYSGAGKTPSARNDPERLRDNIQPYALSGHIHEHEIGHRLNHEVRFHPHVAPFFNGISVTISATVTEPLDPEDVAEKYRVFYADEPVVHVREEIPEVREVVGTPLAVVGGFTTDQRDPRRLTLVVALDNLLKGAASQAMQNLNLALGIEEWTALGR